VVGKGKKEETTMALTTMSKGVQWAVVEDGKVKSLHRSYAAAMRAQDPHWGLVAATPQGATPRGMDTSHLALKVGDECEVSHGAVWPR
jgi:hypothetical protein